MQALLGKSLTVCVAVFIGVMLGVALLLFVQVVLACTARRRSVSGPIHRRPAVAILIPAHDEAAGIASTLTSILSQIDARDRVIVIADNCTDATAAIAASVGATVVERTDLRLRGKGYALDFGIQHLRDDPREIVLMFDADCTAGPSCVEALALEADRFRKPIQALYLIRASNDTVVSRLSEFAQRMRNWVRPLGMWKVGLPCQLMGSGMAFHWSLLDRQSLASGHLTEDLQLGLAFGRQRLYPRFCPLATVDSRSLVDQAGAAVQRTRWEHGHLGTIVSEWPSLALRAIFRLDIRLAAMAWDLAVPPLALFTSTLSIATVVALVVATTSGTWWPLSSIGFAVALLLASICLAQRFFARDLITLREIFFAVPVYLIRKAPVYFRFLFKRQVEWIRTKRDVG